MPLAFKIFNDTTRPASAVVNFFENGIIIRTLGPLALPIITTTRVIEMLNFVLNRTSSVRITYHFCNYTS
jgi:hypothetical protein